MAKGNSLMCFSALQVSYPVTANSPYCSKLVGAATVRQVDVINYVTAPAANAWIYFTGKMPDSFTTANGIVVDIYWTASTAAADDVIWGVAFEYVTGSQLITADSFDTANVITDTGNAGGADFLQICSISFASDEIDDLVPGGDFRVKVYRDTDAAGDDHAGIAQLHMIELKEGV